MIQKIKINRNIVKDANNTLDELERIALENPHLGLDEIQKLHSSKNISDKNLQIDTMNLKYFNSFNNASASFFSDFMSKD